MKSLIFIGGTGFLGQSFFDHLDKFNLKKNKLTKVIVLSRKRKKIESKIKISYITKSISDLKKLPVTDYIIYAANSRNYKEDLRGVYNFKNLLNENHKKTKILLTSSGAVYGKINKKNKIRETAYISLNKVSNFKGYKKNYAKLKITKEKEFYKLSKNGFNIVILRLFSFIGKRIITNKSYAITDLINQAKNSKNKILQLKDPRIVYRGYMYSEDLIRWLLKILRSSDNKFDIYNLGSDEAISIQNLALIIAKKFNKTIKKPKTKNKVVDYYVPSISKAQKKFNLKINYKIRNSLNKLF